MPSMMTLEVGDKDRLRVDIEEPDYMENMSEIWDQLVYEHEAMLTFWQKVCRFVRSAGFRKYAPFPWWSLSRWSMGHWYMWGNMDPLGK